MAKREIDYDVAVEPEIHYEPDAEPREGDKPCSLCHNCRQDKPLMEFDYMADAPELTSECPYVEVQFKNTRKGFYLNSEGLDLHKGDWVAVESTPGHDIGEVVLTGYLVALKMRKSGYDSTTSQRRVFRIARENDMEHYRKAKSREHDTMLRSRQIAEGLGLEMKIGDVEFQGDEQKAIFYYIADGRVDFRQLIKDLAAEFKVRIEMKQIGARQEAGRIGGLGSCGRELCCAKWMTKFQSVGTAAARFQDLSLNPQKLAGQCAKLKCCLNFEVDCYMEASREFPNKDTILTTTEGEYRLFKVDTLLRLCTYTTGRDGGARPVVISTERAHEVCELNKKGIIPATLAPGEKEKETAPSFTDGVGDEALSRFDSKSKKSRNKKRNNDKKKPADKPDEAVADSKGKEEPAAPVAPAPDADGVHGQA